MVCHQFNGNLNKQYKSSKAPDIPVNYRIITDLHDTSKYPMEHQPLQHYLRNEDVVKVIQEILCHDEADHSAFATKHEDTKDHFFKGPIYPSIAKDCLGYTDDPSVSASVSDTPPTGHNDDDLFA